MKLEKLKDSLKSKKILNLYLFSGPEETVKYEILEQIKKIVFKDENQAFDYNELDSVDDINQITEKLDSFPVFSDHTMIVIKDYEKLKADVKKGLKEYVEDYSVPDYAYLIIFSKEKYKSSDYKYGRAFNIDIEKQKGSIVNFFELEELDLKKYIINEYKHFEKNPENSLVTLLSTDYSSDLAILKTEIKKTAIFTSDKKDVMLDEVKPILSDVKNTNEFLFFTFLDSLCLKKVKRSLLEFEELLKNNIHYIYANTMCFTRFNDLYMLKLLEADHKLKVETFKRVAKRFYGSKKRDYRILAQFNRDMEHFSKMQNFDYDKKKFILSYRGEKMLKLLYIIDNFSYKEIKSIITLFAEFDLKMKSTTNDFNSYFKEEIIKICSGYYRV